ncbi:MAG: hypothetical protein P4L46_01980 [Fimbriimonas sp.]|nr:hypothetical protein [Fimbriimonas sp.]
MSVSNFTQTTGGKVGIAIVVVAAIGALVFEFMHYGSGDGSRNVPAKEVVSEAQQQIDAINKMTNLSPEQKKAMIAHEQGEIATAKGQGSPPGMPAQGAPR